jgi:hypothetical protein
VPAAKRELTIDEIRALLEELGRRLADEGVTGQLYVVGDAAIAFEFDQRRITADVDAVMHPVVTVRRIAQAMAEDHELPAAWLNDSVRAFLPGGPDTQAVALDVPGLAVAFASPRHLLAMKMAAYRPGKDQADLELLFEALGVKTAADAADIALAIYEDTVVLPDRDELLLSAQAVLDRLAGRRRRGMTP